MKKENKNFMYNVLYQIFSFIVPLITAPYIARTLGVNKIGIYAYTYSIVNYFMLATMLGINNYGSSMIAKVCDNNENRAKKFWSIYFLQLSNGFIMFIIYNILNIFVFKQYNTLLFINNIFLLSTIIDINWYFFGMEKFKLTINRNIIIKILSLILIFLFVRGQDGLIYYTLIMNITAIISQLYLWLHIRKEILFVKPSVKDVLSNLKRCLILFIPVIAYSIYRVMDKTMLGSISSTIELGFYENAEKIINIPVSIITALGTVMLPNVSKTKTKEELNEKIMSSFKLCFCFIIPMFFGLIALGKDFAVIFYGSEFLKSGSIIIFLSFTIVFAAIANVIRTNFLIPKEKDNVYVSSTILGAIINLILNIIFIPKFGSYGACIGTISAEFTVMLVQLICVRKDIDINKVFKLFLMYLIKGLIMFTIIVLIGKLIDSVLLRFFVELFIAIVIYFILNYKYILYDFLSLKNKK